MAYARRDIRGGAVQTTISGAISDSATSCSIAATTGWPDGGVGGFYVVIDPGTASEEKILCSTRSSGTVNFTTRGADGSTAASHSSGAVIYPVMVAVDADEANYWVAELAGAINAAGDLPIGDGADSLTTLAKGSNSTVLQVSSGGTLQYGTITSAMITDGTIVAGDIADGTITAAKLAAGAGDSWTSVIKTADESVTSSTTLQNDDHLLFTATNASVFAIRGVLLHTGGSAGDLKVAFGEDSTATRGEILSIGVGASGSTQNYSAPTDQTTTHDLFNNDATDLRVTAFQGIHTGAGGTFRVLWAQLASDGTATTIKKGSYLEYKAVA